MSIFSGLFASSLLSLFVCIFNYLVFRKNIVEALVISAYRMNADSYSCLFSTEKDLSLEKALTVLNILNDRLYNIYVNNHELLIGLFWFNNVKKDIKNLERKIETQVKKTSSIEFYIEFYENEAKKQTKQIYKDLDAIIDNNEIYIQLLNISKKCGGNIYSFEPYDLEKKYKKLSADIYKAALK